MVYGSLFVLFSAGNWLGVVNPMINQPRFYQRLVDVQPFPLGFPVPNWPNWNQSALQIRKDLLLSHLPEHFQCPLHLEITRNPRRNGLKPTDLWAEMKESGIYAKDLRWFYHLKSKTFQCPGVCTRYVELCWTHLGKSFSGELEQVNWIHGFSCNFKTRTCTLMDFSSLVLPFLWRNQAFLTSWIRLMEIVFSTMQTSMLRNRLTEINPPEKRVQKNVLPVYPWP